MTEPFTSPAIAALEAAGIPFRLVRTEIARNAEESAAFQGIPVGSLLRSILVRRAADDYLFVLVPGGRRFDWPKLRAHLGTSRLSLPDAGAAPLAGHRGRVDPGPGLGGDRRRRSWRQRARDAGGPDRGNRRRGPGHQRARATGGRLTPRQGYHRC
jgi:hypothetical protein